MKPHVERPIPLPVPPPLSAADREEIERLVIEDDEPVDSIFAEKQQRLLTAPLYESWTGPGDDRPFAAFANVGLFPARKQPPVVPDMMLSLDMPAGRDLSRKENRTYIQWVIGKPPDVVVEIVSDRRGGELGYKRRRYATAGVKYYVVFDPEQHLGDDVLQAFELQADGKYHPISPAWFPEVGLGLTFWEGTFEGQEATWLRWCDQEGTVLPTGQERAVVEAEQAQMEKQRVRQERRRTRQQQQRAQEAEERAEQEKQRAEQEKQRADALRAQLRALGINPDA